MASAGTPQSSKAKAPPQVPPQDPQDNPKDTVASALADVTAYATATLGLLSSNKGQMVTTVNTSDSNNGGDKKMPMVETPPKPEDSPDQQGMINMASNRNITVCVVPTHTDAANDGLGRPWMSRGFGEGTPFLATQSGIQFISQADTMQGTTPPNQ